MNAGNFKRQALHLAIGIVIGALGCVLVWKIVPLVSREDSPPRVAQGPHAPPGSQLVNISMVGFDPAEIPAKAGQPLKLAFFRPDATNCAREVVFPALGIRKELPPGETTVVDITPPKSGTFGFACGMNMLKGKLIVQ
jgi:plastocyanin domain-containing protein